MMTHTQPYTQRDTEDDSWVVLQDGNYTITPADFLLFADLHEIELDNDLKTATSDEHLMMMLLMESEF